MLIGLHRYYMKYNKKSPLIKNVFISIIRLYIILIQIATRENRLQNRFSLIEVNFIKKIINQFFELFFKS